MISHTIPSTTIIVIIMNISISTSDLTAMSKAMIAIIIIMIHNIVVLRATDYDSINIVFRVLPRVDLRLKIVRMVHLLRLLRVILSLRHLSFLLFEVRRPFRPPRCA